MALESWNWVLFMEIMAKTVEPLWWSYQRYLMKNNFFQWKSIIDKRIIILYIQVDIFMDGKLAETCVSLHLSVLRGHVIFRKIC